jgi:hypothetical protein
MENIKGSKAARKGRKEQYGKREMKKGKKHGRKNGSKGSK